jgi:hypothetical protein
VELISAGVVCGSGPFGVCTGYVAYALVVGAISLVLCVLLLLVDQETWKGLDKAVALFLCLWWALGMGIMTIVAPFRAFFIYFLCLRAIYAIIVDPYAYKFVIC